MDPGTSTSQSIAHADKARLKVEQQSSLKTIPLPEGASNIQPLYDRPLSHVTNVKEDLQSKEQDVNVCEERHELSTPSRPDSTSTCTESKNSPTPRKGKACFFTSIKPQNRMCGNAINIHLMQEI